MIRRKFLVSNQMAEFIPINNWEDWENIKDTNPGLRQATFIILDDSIEVNDISIFLADLGFEKRGPECHCLPQPQTVDLRFIYRDFVVYITDDSLAIIADKPLFREIRGRKEYYSFSSFIGAINTYLPLCHLQLPLDNAGFLDNAGLDCLTSIIFNYTTPLSHSIDSLVYLLQEPAIVDYNLSGVNLKDKEEINASLRLLFNELKREDIDISHVKSFIPLTWRYLNYTPGEIVRTYDFEIIDDIKENKDWRIDEDKVIGDKLFEITMTLPVDDPSSEERMAIITTAFNDPSKVSFIFSPLQTEELMARQGFI